MLHLPDDIYYHVLSYDPEAATTWMTWLDAVEQKRLAAFGSPKRQQEFLTGRAAARFLVAQKLHLRPEAVRIRIGPDDAPELDHENWHLSIAHSAQKAVAVMSPAPVGADLEAIVPRRPDLFRYILHPEEYDLLDTLPLDRNEAMILCWSLKEAVLKARRSGFRYSPKKIRLTIAFAQKKAQAATKDGQTWALCFKKLADCYLSIAFPA